MVLLIFEDAVGVLVVAEVLPEAADVVLHDAVARDAGRLRAQGEQEEVAQPRGGGAPAPLQRVGSRHAAR